MSTYLSIDLDYWRYFNDDWHSKRFFERVLALGLPITVALHHHHLLWSINRRARGLTRVINVDYHSDITEEDFQPFELNEGTWANFVQRPEQMTFEWRYPSADCLDSQTGYCHTYANPFKKTCTRWRRVVKKLGVARIPWSDVQAVGVCLSPGWLDRPWTVHDAVDQFKLHEWFSRWTFCRDSNAPTDMDAENGTGIFSPRLIRSKI